MRRPAIVLIVAAAAVAAGGCTAILAFDPESLPEGDVPEGDGGADADGDSEGDGAPDSDGDSGGEVGCGEPHGIGATQLSAAGCAELSSASLSAVALEGSCTVDTDVCALDCSTGAEIHLDGCSVAPSDSLLSSSTVCVLVVQSLHVGPSARLHVDGPRALALLATGSITVEGGLSADAAGAEPGAGGWGGGDGAGEGPGAGSAATTSTRAGGGGAGHGEPGGPGGCPEGGDSGGAYGSCDEPRLEGGSGGGGLGCAEAPPCADPLWGGGGGGAVQLFSRTSVVVAEGGLVSASGARGATTPASNARGGGGGGSGGTVLIEAPTVRVSGTVAAIGGEGGAGFGDAEGGASAAPGECSASIDGLGGGGGGGPGRVYIGTREGHVEGAGSINPELAGCVERLIDCP